MKNESDRYELLKKAYDFLGEQIYRFETTVEMQVAEYNLLRAVGEFTAADRVQLCMHYAGEFRLESEWREGMDGPFAYKRGERLPGDARWIARFRRRESVYVPDTERMDEEIACGRETVREAGIHALYELPIVSGDRLLAVVTVCNPQSRTLEALDEIRVVLGNWLAGRLEKGGGLTATALKGLGTDYTGVYILNLDTDHYEIVHSQAINNINSVAPVPYFHFFLNDYVKGYVLPNYRKTVLDALSTENIRRHFETESDYHCTYETVPNLGGERNFQIHVIRQYFDDKHFAVIGVRCIDEIVQRERELKAKVDRANTLLHQQLDFITSCLPGGLKISKSDRNSTFVYASRQLAAMLGYKNEQALIEAANGTYHDLIHPDDRKTVYKAAVSQISEGGRYNATCRLMCADGTWKYVEDAGRRVRNEKGEMEFWNIILDKNELMEKTNELALEKRSNRQKTDFLSRMSHDMRTPLSGIIGLLDLCERHPDDRALYEESRRKMRIAADHLLSLINDTLELSKLGDENIVLYEEPFDLRDMMNEVRTITGMRAEEDKIDLRFAGEPEDMPYPYLVGSPLYIRQIFINLITNSIKYNRDGGRVHCALHQTREEDGRIRLDSCIRDSGIGMSEAFQKKMFEPFVQADNSARSVFKGTGLGMPIVKNLLDRMGGTISVESEENIGTTVTVSLWLTPSDEKTVHPDAVQAAPPDLGGVRVLLAEDNALNREIASYVLHDEGMEVTEAENGEKAVETYLNAPAHSFDVILMDIMMPVMDGIEAAGHIRASGREDAQTIPIFALSANAFIEDKRRTRDAGMNEHLSKPLDTKELIAAIAKYCNK